MQLKRTHSHGTLHTPAPPSALINLWYERKFLHWEGRFMVWLPSVLPEFFVEYFRGAPSELERTRSHGTLHDPTPLSAFQIFETSFYL